MAKMTADGGVIFSVSDLQGMSEATERDMLLRGGGDALEAMALRLSNALGADHPEVKAAHRRVRLYHRDRMTLAGMQAHLGHLLASFNRSIADLREQMAALGPDHPLTRQIRRSCVQTQELMAELAQDIFERVTSGITDEDVAAYRSTDDLPGGRRL